ncbi:MAG: ABC transporter permease [Acidobacteriota bacterium]
MDYAAVLRVAIRALARNKMRSILTMLGIIIGVGAVISTVAIGVGASNQVQEAIRNLGNNIVFISAGSINRRGVHMGSEATKTLTVGDAKAITQQIPFISKVSPGVRSGGQVVYSGQNWFTSFHGVTPDYLDIRRWPVREGSVFTQHDVDTASDVCLLGLTVAQNLFGNEDPVGKMVRIKNIPFRVLGVLSSKGQSPFGRDEDDRILMPYTTVQKKMAGIDWLNFIMCSASSQNAINASRRQIAALLRERHRLRTDEEDDFIIRSPNDLAQAQAESGRVMTLLLASIASVSLLVGGIGIMNIMLVSVTERTREIGVRMAVGATEGDVQNQFLAEAMVLSSIGGAVGVVAGIVGSRAVSNMLQWPTQIPLESVLIAVVFSVSVGIFFGYYPARKAARLDPIEALRYE